MVRIRIQNHINEQTGSLYISRRKTSQYKIGQDRKIHRKELNKRCSPILVFRKISTETTTDYYLIIPKWQNFNKLLIPKRIERMTVRWQISTAALEINLIMSSKLEDIYLKSHRCK